MSARIKFTTPSYGIVQAMSELQGHVNKSGLETNLLHLNVSGGIAHQRLRLLH